MVNKKSMLARVCYNTKKWRKPSGEHGKSKNGCFEDVNGFGFDEWLNAPLSYNGYCYAFIQGAPISDKTIYHYDRIKLFSYSDGQWFYEGYIDNVETIRDREAAVVLNNNYGIVQIRSHELSNLNGKHLASSFYEYEISHHPHNVLNVKFLPEDFHFCPNIATPTDKHPRGYRYLLTKED